MIEQLKGQYKIADLCQIADVSISGFYYYLNHKNEYKDYELIMEICSLQKLTNYTYGYRKITAAINKTPGISYNKKRIYRLMKENDLLSVIKKKRKKYLKESFYKTNNKLKRDFNSDIRYEKLVTDITEIKIHNRKIYLSAVIDCFNNEVVSYEISNFNNLKLVNDTFKKLIEKKSYFEGSIIHSDQGFQYTHKFHNKQMEKHGIIQSMSRKGTPLDNAVIESFFGTMKSELLYNEKLDIKDVEEFKVKLEEWIVYYNNTRIQAKLNYKAPKEHKKAV